MKLIKIFNHSDGFIDPNGENLLAVASDAVDSEDPWMPSHSQSFANRDELKNWLLRIVASGEQIIVRSSNELAPLIQELGLIHLVSEWRTAR